MVEDWVKEGVIEKFNLYSMLAFIDFSEGALVYFSHHSGCFYPGFRMAVVFNRQANLQEPI